jgi:hypothetical protein
MPDVLRKLRMVTDDSFPSFSKVNLREENGNLVFDRKCFIQFLEFAHATREQIAIICSDAYTTFYALMVWYLIWNVKTEETNPVFESIRLNAPVNHDAEFPNAPTTLQ